MATATALENVRDLVPTIVKRREEVEAGRRVPLDLVDDLVRAGCFRMGVPKAFGGGEAPLSAILEVCEELARADGSVGWTVMIGIVTPDLCALLPRQTFERIYAATPDVVGGGALAPKGAATPEPGGYRVRGQWPFGSGSQHCTWLTGHCMVMDGEGPRTDADGLPEMRLAFLPASEWEIVDTWHVVGLRGTGSHDLRLTDAFVPEDQTCTLFGLPSIDAALYRIPLLGKFALHLGAVAIGIARGAIEEIAALARDKRPAFMPQRLATIPHFQAELGKADATLRAARALLYHEAGRAWAAAQANDTFTPLHRVQLRATGPQIATMTTQVVDAAYTLGGGTAPYDECPLQRRLRDIHTLTHRAAVSGAQVGLLGAALAGEDVDLRRG